MGECGRVGWSWRHSWLCTRAPSRSPDAPVCSSSAAILRVWVGWFGPCVCVCCLPACCCGLGDKRRSEAGRLRQLQVVVGRPSQEGPKRCRKAPVCVVEFGANSGVSVQWRAHSVVHKTIRSVGDRQRFDRDMMIEDRSLALCAQEATSTTSSTSSSISSQVPLAARTNRMPPRRVDFGRPIASLTQSQSTPQPTHPTAGLQTAPN